MRRIFKVLGLAMVITAILAFALAGTVLADANGYTVPPEESGDGIPNQDGLPIDVELGPGFGPAPNAGDGIQDGSGF
ncbi:hypothetical protein ACFLV3_03455 [Chloroflexota bacterium]